MKLIKRIFFFSIVFVLTFGAGLGMFHHLGLFRVDSIPVEVIGLSDVNVMRHSPGASADLQARLQKQLHQFDHLKIWEVGLGQVQAAIMRDEWVKEVRISRALPNEIRVLVKPQTPVFVWLPSEGTSAAATGADKEKQNLLVPVAEDGRMLSPLAADALPDVPILRGDKFAQDEALRKKAVLFMRSLPETGALSRKNVSELAWTPEEGFVLSLNDPHTTVKLGDDQLDTKVLRVAQVFGYLSTNHLKGRVIDASFSKKVLVRLRKAP